MSQNKEADAIYPHKRGPRLSIFIIMIIETILEALKELKQTWSHDLSDRLTTYMMAFILVSGALVTFKFTVNSPFVCFNPVNPSGEKFTDYALNYAWTHGSIPVSALKGAMPEDKSGWKTLYEKNGIFYYQWIPAILFIMFLSLFLCRQIWVRVCATTATCNINSLISSLSSIRSQDNDKIGKLAVTLRTMIRKKHARMDFFSEVRHGIQKKLRCLGFSRKFGSWIFANYVIFKVSTMVTCLTMALMTLVVFQVDLAVLAGIWNQHSAVNERFPRSVIAYVPNTIGLGGNNHYVTHCVTAVNMISEKLFPLMIVLFLLLAFSHLISLTLWLSKVGSRSYRKHFVKKCLTRTNGHLEKKKIDEFIEEFLTWDGVFLLMMIRNNSDHWLAGKLVSRLWVDFLSEQLDTVVDVCLLTNKKCRSKINI